jgi:hypothetical protein
MRKLTKIIKKRRKNYKPTTGVVNQWGIRESVNTEIIKAQRAEARRQILREEKRKLRAEFYRIVRETFPGFAALEDAAISVFGLNPFNMYMPD